MIRRLASLLTIALAAGCSASGTGTNEPASVHTDNPPGARAPPQSAPQPLTPREEALNAECRGPREAGGCVELANLRVAAGDAWGARKVLKRACPRDGAVFHDPSCEILAPLAWRGVGGPADRKAGARAAEIGCTGGYETNLVEAEACVVWAEVLYEGIHAKPERSDVRDALVRACRLGHHGSCRGLPPRLVRRWTFGHFIKLPVGDLEVNSLSCDLQLEEPGYLADAEVLATAVLRAKNAEVHRCLGEAPVDVEWEQEGGTVTSVLTRAKDPQVDACLRTALAGGPTPVTGRCLANLSRASPSG